jgi:excisionase family DNA binding protein
MTAAFKLALKENRPVRVQPLAEAAEVSPATLYALVARGEVQSVRIGKSIRIPASVAKKMLGM